MLLAGHDQAAERTDDDADPIAHAIQVMALGRLPGLIVVDAEQRPRVVLPGTQVLKLAVPAAYQEDMALTRAEWKIVWERLRSGMIAASCMIFWSACCQ